MTDRLALAGVIEDGGIPRDKAVAIATAIFDVIHDNVATKADVTALGSELRADLRATETRLNTLIAVLRADLEALPNSLTLRLGGVVVVVATVLFAALHYWPPHG